jgi:hypothetical protein
MGVAVSVASRLSGPARERDHCPACAAIVAASSSKSK